MHEIAAQAVKSGEADSMQRASIVATAFMSATVFPPAAPARFAESRPLNLTKDEDIELYAEFLAGSFVRPCGRVRRIFQFEPLKGRHSDPRG